MKRKPNMLIFPALVAAIVTFACGGGSAIATSVPPQSTQETQVDVMPTEQSSQNSGTLEIVSDSSYIDSFNDYNVVGELVNNSSEMIENITLELSITDATGATLLRDSDDNPVDRVEIQPYLTVLLPGASSAFNYYISADGVNPANYEVSIKRFDESSAPGQADLKIENVQTAQMDDGDVLITGELINATSRQVDVETLAGAVLDDANHVLAAGSTLTYSRYLYPAGDTAGRDRGPFILKLYGPIQNATQWKMYFRAIENTSPSSSDVEVQLGNSYIDAYGSYHLLGTIRNNGADQISPAVIGGLYAEDKSVVDAASIGIPLYLNAGDVAPFDLNSFQVIGTSTADQAAPAEKVVKPDLYWTFTTDYELVSLEAKDVSVKPDGYTWTMEGTVVNTSDKKLGSVNVAIMFLDGNQKVMAANSVAMYPEEGSDVIEPGDSNQFSMSIYAPDGLDLSSQDYQVMLQGVVSQ